MARPGLYGKLPAVGDFVSRGFSPTLCDRIDGLIQAALEAAAGVGGETRQVMEGSWPVMIAFRPGALCATGFTGLWFPSQDRVGRAFPLCIGYELSELGPALPWPSASMASQLLHLAVQATQNGVGVDELLAMLPETDDWLASAMHEQPFGDSSDETVPDVSFGVRMFALQGPEKRMPMSARALGGRLPWVSQVLGTVLNAEADVAWFFGSRAMPQLPQFAALFDGEWERWSWAVSHADPIPQPNTQAPS